LKLKKSVIENLTNHLFGFAIKLKGSIIGLKLTYPTLNILISRGSGRSGLGLKNGHVGDYLFAANAISKI
jgi:hypothetical protein